MHNKTLQTTIRQAWLAQLKLKDGSCLAPVEVGISQAVKDFLGEKFKNAIGNKPGLSREELRALFLDCTKMEREP